MSKSNNPPYVVLELDKIEAEWLYKALFRNKAEMQEGFKDVCSMPSSDPRARMRSTLTLMLSAEMAISEGTMDRMEGQQPDLRQTTATYESFLDKLKLPDTKGDPV